MGHGLDIKYTRMRLYSSQYCYDVFVVLIQGNFSVYYRYHYLTFVEIGYIRIGIDYYWNIGMA